jgi:hypothetical protein
VRGSLRFECDDGPQVRRLGHVSKCSIFTFSNILSIVMRSPSWWKFSREYWWR